MTDNEFAKNIAELHTETPDFLLKEIKGFLSGYTGDQIEHLYGKYLLSNASKFQPKGLADFRSIADENGIYKHSEKTRVQFWVCNNCKSRFSVMSHGCPKCHTQSFSAVIADKLPTDLIMVKDGCWRCPFYQSGFRPFGPTCAEWGKIDNGVREAEHPPQPRQCNGCRCASCCAQEYQSRAGDKDALNRLTGGVGGRGGADTVKKAMVDAVTHKTAR